MSDMSHDGPPTRRWTVEGFDYFWSTARDPAMVASVVCPAGAHPHLAAMAAADAHAEVRAAATATLALHRPPPACGRGSETCELLASCSGVGRTAPPLAHPQPLPQAGGEQDTSMPLIIDPPDTPELDLAAL